MNTRKRFRQRCAELLRKNLGHALPGIIAALAMMQLAAAAESRGEGEKRPVLVAKSFLPAFPAQRMVALAEEQLLLWHGDGQAQARRSDGTWTEPWKMPVHAVRDLRPDGAGFLALGALAPNKAAIVQMSAEGAELERWETEERAPFSIFVNAHGSWAITSEGWLPLLAGGVLGAPENLVGDDHPRAAIPPAVIVHDAEGTITWRAPDLSKAHPSAGVCQKLGPAGWKVEGAFMSAPVRSGQWLVFAEPSRKAGITVRSLATGTVAGQIPALSEAVIADAGAEQLLVGDERLRLVELPSGKTTWASSPLPARVADLTVLRDSFAYRLEGSPEVFFAPRPR